MPNEFPPWLRRPWASGESFVHTRELLRELKLNTVCQSARCPNLGECWGRGTATVMVLGNTCTRNCGFCSVHSGRPEAVDADEPLHVARAVRGMGLRHAVVTTVVRDDLADGGAAHIAATIRAIHDLNPATSVEVLVSDFNGDPETIQLVLEAEPEIFGHNIEAVRRIYPMIRDRRFTYDRAVHVLELASEHASGAIIKSAMMVGHGESPEEVRQTMQDLRRAGCEAVCIGQYLRPSKQQRAVAEFITPVQFEAYGEMALAQGLKFVVSEPFARSSYRSEEVLNEAFARERLSHGATATTSGRADE